MHQSTPVNLHGVSTADRRTPGSTCNSTCGAIKLHLNLNQDGLGRITRRGGPSHRRQTETNDRQARIQGRWFRGRAREGPERGQGGGREGAGGQRQKWFQGLFVPQEWNKTGEKLSRTSGGVRGLRGTSSSGAMEAATVHREIAKNPGVDSRTGRTCLTRAILTINHSECDLKAFFCSHDEFDSS